MSVNKRIINTFLELVKINSISRQEADLRRHLINIFHQLGCRSRTDKKGNLHFKLRGVLANGPTLLFNAHMDTVIPGTNIKPIIKKDRIISDGTTILGADDKAGIAGIIEMVRLLKERKVLYKEIKIIFTVEEEIGLQGAKQLSYSDVEADYCFVLDSDGNTGSIVVKAPAQEQIGITVRGKAAHAGICPEKGISAIQIASEAITGLQLGRIDAETTANIGIIKGGSATNIIPEEVQIKAEARSHDEDKLQNLVHKIVQTFKKTAEKFGGEVEFDIKRSYNRVAVSRNAEIVQIAGKAAEKLGLKHQIKSSGGGSDASIIYSYGVPTIALCIGMEQVHSKQEYITLKNLTDLPEYLIEIVKTAQKYGLS